MVSSAKIGLIQCRRSTLVFNQQRIHSSCTLRQLKIIAQQVWGEQVFSENQSFFVELEQVMNVLATKAQQAGFAPNFNPGKIYAATALAVSAHVETDGPDKGAPVRRKLNDELYLRHPFRVMAKLVGEDVPYLGTDGYCAAILHDTVEDNENLHHQDVELAFGRRVAGIVKVLTYLKTRKNETKLDQADKYDAVFVAEVREYIEALYIKMKDVEDYFETCGHGVEGYTGKKLSSTSVFYHFRFVDEVLYPLAMGEAGAQASALALANLALRITHPADYDYYTSYIDALVSVHEPAKWASQFALAIGELGEVSVTVRSPYEMLVKAREHGFLLRHAPDITERFEPEIRDVLFFDVLTSSKPDCSRVRKKLEEVLPQAYPGGRFRVRNFIVRPKSTKYQALHLDYRNAEVYFRFRIFSDVMQEVNQRGAAQALFGMRGMRRLTSTLLTEAVLEKVQRTDRNGRRTLLQRLPRIRQVAVNVMDPTNEVEGIPINPLVYQGDSLLDIAAAYAPSVALRFGRARLRGRIHQSQAEIAKRRQWIAGQRVNIQLVPTWTGLDVYSQLREPYAIGELREYVAALEPRDQVKIGRRMLGELLLCEFKGLVGQLSDERAGWFEKAFQLAAVEAIPGEVSARETMDITAISEREAYRQIALGRVLLPSLGSMIKEVVSDGWTFG